MFVVEAPNDYPSEADLFLAGGISNCPDWQQQVIHLLDGEDIVVLNPRRREVFTEDIADAQIRWEYGALKSVKTVLFWFPKETLCPITLFELGVFSQRTNTRLLVGTHPDYARRFDVEVQMKLSRPEVIIHDNIEDMVADYLSALQADAMLEGYVQLAANPEYRDAADQRKANRTNQRKRPPRTIDELVEQHQKRQ